jgi:hypothetical protein
VQVTISFTNINMNTPYLASPFFIVGDSFTHGTRLVSVPVVPSTFLSVFRNSILNADPGPATRINADPCGSGTLPLVQL